jgi:hypothetical protein
LRLSASSRSNRTAIFMAGTRLICWSNSRGAESPRRWFGLESHTCPCMWIRSSATPRSSRC